MATSWLRLISLKLLNRRNAYAEVQKSLYCTTDAENEATKPQRSGFAVFDEKQTQLIYKPEKSPESFVSLLRNSKFIAMGDPVEKIVVGEIYHIVGGDLYIDFGWKFPTVCTLPERNKEFYVLGTKVKLRIKDLELSTKFLGGEEEITLHEADCVLLGLLKRPPKPLHEWYERKSTSILRNAFLLA